MEVLELEGKKFVKASRIARELGYTADYIGQLCRSGKIDAQLVGRSWYVLEDSIVSHKGQKQRSSRAKTKNALRVEINKQKQVTEEPTTDEAIAIPVHHTKKSRKPFFYARAKETATVYVADETELIPGVTAAHGSHSKRLPVSPGGAKNIAISSKSDQYALSATELPKVQFSGSLSVTDVHEEAPPVSEENEDTVTVDAEPAKVGKAESPETTNTSTEVTEKAESEEKKPKIHTTTAEEEIKALIAERDARRKKQHKENKPKKHVVPKQREDVTVQHLVIKSLDDGPYAHPRGATILLVSSSVVFGLILALALLSVETSTTISTRSEGPDVDYGFNVSSAQEALKLLK